MTVSIHWITPDAQAVIVEAARVSSDPNAAKRPDADLLRYLIDYDPETGSAKWRERDPALFLGGSYCPERRARRWNSRFAGNSCGVDNGSGYIATRIYGKSYKLHRLVWCIFYGSWPSKHVDHINGVRSDNRITNLRDVSQGENNRNARIRVDNASGVAGVFQRGEAFEASIGHRGSLRYLGRFKNLSEAKKARMDAMEELGYSKFHGGYN